MVAVFATTVRCDDGPSQPTIASTSALQASVSHKLAQAAIV
jgi:hypothetical protein